MDDRNLYGKAYGLNERGRFSTFGKALDAAIKDLATEKSEFFDSLADKWATLFPGLRARPGRYEDGVVYVYVQSAPQLFAVRPRLRSIKAKLAALPGAPAKLDVRLEVRQR
ncbi:MAG: DUF721 domain-containing protein [Kiritimatiellae bacterium]|nr:DUF721 domain-containing protein [Kiritimatiellia bacterium]